MSPRCFLSWLETLDKHRAGDTGVHASTPFGVVGRRVSRESGGSVRFTSVTVVSNLDPLWASLRGIGAGCSNYVAALESLV